MSDSEPRNLWKVFKHALKTPFVILSLCVALVVGLAEPNFGGYVIVAAALAAAAGYTLIKLRSDEFIRQALRQDDTLRREADRMNRTFRIEELDVEARVRMKNIVRLQSEIAEEVANSPIDEVAVGLEDTVHQTERMVDRGLDMAQKRRDLLRYLRQTDALAIQARVESLEQKLQQDQEHREETEALLSTKRGELTDYAAIDQAAASVLEQLDTIESGLSSLRAKLVRIKSTDISDWVAANDELKTELGNLNVSVESVEKSIEEVLSVGRQGGSGASE